MPGGGVVAELLGNVPRRREQRLIQFVQRLAEEIDATGVRLDQEFVRSDEFADLFEDIMEKTRSRREMDKIAYYAAALTNAATRDRPDQVVRDRMLAVLEELRHSHLTLLALVATTRDGAPPAMYSGGVETTIKHQWPDVDMEQIRMDWGDLARVSLLEAYPSGMMTRQGATDLTVRMTPFGLRFHAFVCPRP